MEIKTTFESTSVAVVSLKGRLDLLSAGAFKSALSQLVSQGRPKLLVDLGDVSFVDSSGLGAIIGGLKAARQAGGDLRIARPRDQARTVLELTTLDRVLKIYATVAEALTGY
jgi:anti-sigma B factor antagonist